MLLRAPSVPADQMAATGSVYERQTLDGVQGISDAEQEAIRFLEIRRTRRSTISRRTFAAGDWFVASGKTFSRSLTSPSTAGLRHPCCVMTLQLTLCDLVDRLLMREIAAKAGNLHMVRWHRAGCALHVPSIGKACSAECRLTCLVYAAAAYTSSSSSSCVRSRVQPSFYNPSLLQACGARSAVHLAGSA